MAWRGEVEDGMGWGGLVASRAEQRAEARLAALERDAARYRWMRDQRNREKAADLALHRMNLDAAIDAAMAGANL